VSDNKRARERGSDQNKTNKQYTNEKIKEIEI
jgi:hypothetical protein